MTHLEESLQRDLDRIRSNVAEMSQRAEEALEGCVKALVDADRQLACTVMLRDLYIDKQEKEIDRLCLEFLVRQQPVGGSLRFAYSTIKVNLEIERVGDYAESIARHLLKLTVRPPADLLDRIVEMSRMSIRMFSDAVAAFVGQNAESARRCMAVEETIDMLRAQLNAALVKLLVERSISYDTFEPLLTVIRRFERVSDQARNICMETLYTCTGESVKHPGAEAFRILFVDDDNGWRSQMAEAIGTALNRPRFNFESAGIDIKPVSNRGFAEFMKSKGHDLAHAVPKAIHQVEALDHYHLIVALCDRVRRDLPETPRKSVFLEWPLEPGPEAGSPADVSERIYAQTYEHLNSSIVDLVSAIDKAESPQGSDLT